MHVWLILSKELNLEVRKMLFVAEARDGNFTPNMTNPPLLGQVWEV